MGNEASRLIKYSAIGDLVVVNEIIASGNEGIVDSKDTFGNTALVVAARCGHLVVVRRLLDAFADIDSQNSEGDTALIWAVREGHSKLVHLLLEYGADVEVQNAMKQNAIDVAEEMGRRDVFQLLSRSRYFAEVDSFESLQNIPEDPSPKRKRRRSGASSTTKRYTLYTRLFGMLLIPRSSPKPPKMRRNVPAKGLGNARHPELSAKLIRAAKENDVEALTKMEEELGDVFRVVVDESGAAGVMTAATHGCIAALRRLLLLGSPSLVGDQTAVAAAAVYNKLDAVTLLYSFNADMSARNRFGNTPLHVAASQGHTTIVKFLATAGYVDVNSRNTRDGSTPLMKAARQGREGAVSFLLALGGDPNSVDFVGNTAMMEAARRGQRRIVSELIASGGKVEYINLDGHDALTLLEESEQKGDCRELIATMTSMLQDRPLIPSPRYDQEEIDKRFRDEEEAEKKLYNMCVPKDMDEEHDDYGVAILMNAARLGCATAAHDVSMRDSSLAGRCDSEGRTPLMVAAQEGHPRLVGLIRQFLVTSDNIDEEGRTALMMSAVRGDDISLDILLLNKANPLQKDNEGHDALVHALLNKNEACAERLLSMKKMRGFARNNKEIYFQCCDKYFPSYSEKMRKKLK